MPFNSTQILWVSASLLGLALTSCTPSVDTDIEYNERPTAEILSHVTGALVVEGDKILLRGQAADADDETADLLATWHNGEDKYCATAPPNADGTTECEVTVGATAFTVVLDISDPEDASGTVSVQIEVTPTDSPVVSLSSPIDFETYYAGAFVAFEGVVSDTEDAPEDLTVWFESSESGDLGLDVVVTEKGVVTAIGTLVEGSQSIRMVAIDTTGKTSSDSVVVRVSEENVPPLCQIDAPTADDVSVSGEPLTLSGLVSDANIEPQDLTVNWRSDIDGSLGSSTPNEKGVVSLAVKTLSVGAHTLRLTVTDDAADSCVASTMHVVGTLPVVALTAPVKGDVFTLGSSVTFVGTVSDEQDTETDIALEWSSNIDGVFSYEGPALLGLIDFSYGNLSAGPHTITLKATDTDGLSQSVSVDLTINETPTIPDITVTPNPADSSVDLVASIDTESTDPEGDKVVYTWSWLRDGVDSEVSATETLLAENTSKGEVWTAVLTPNDGYTDGPAGTSSVTIENGTPEIFSVALDPDPAGTDDTIGVLIDASDPDDDALSYSYTWFVDGLEILPAGATLRGTIFFDRDQTISVEVVANDGTVDSVAMNSDTLTVQNTAPVMTVVQIMPFVVDATTDVSVIVLSEDADNDDVEVSYTWFVDGIDAGVTEDTLPVESFSVLQEIWVEATPFDGVDYGDTVSSSAVVVGNSAPTIDSVEISPQEAWTDDLLTAVVTATDADGEDVTFTYQWRENNVPIVGANGETLDGTTEFGRDDSITVRVTPTDGVNTGLPVSSDAVVIENTAPVASDLVLSTSEIYTADFLASSIVVEDADNDSTTTDYAWVVDGITVGSGPFINGLVLFDKGQEVYLQATPSDGDASGNTLTTETLTVLNSAPVVTAVEISPASPTTEDTLTVAVVSDDDDSDPVTYSYAWSVGGVDTGETSSSLDGSVWFATGAAIRVTVTANDGEDDSEPFTSAEVSVGNTAPVITSVLVSPDPLYTDSIAEAVVDVDDVDGDSISLTYTWLINGVPVVTETASTLDGSVNFDTGDRVILRVMPSDGMLSGAVVSSVVMTVEDSLPTVNFATLDSSTVYTDDIIEVNATANDADGDSFSLEYKWYVDGALIPISGSTLSGTAWFDKGQTVYCEVNGTGAEGDGPALATETIVISNSLPVVNTITLSPSSPGSGDMVVATVSGDDSDGDSVTYTYQWTVDGTLTPVTGSSLNGAIWFTDGQEIRVIVTPNDGVQNGLPVVSSPVTSVNAVPEVTSISLTPAVAQTNTVVTVNTTTEDADGDSVVLSYAWYVDGVRQMGVAGDSIDGATAFDKGQQIYVQVTPTDGKDFGVPVTSSPLTVDNTLPVIFSVSILPVSPYTTANLSLTVTSADADNDLVSLSYQWFIDGVENAWTGAYLSSAMFEKNQTISVTVTPNDGDSDGTAASSSAVLVVNTPPTVLSATLSPVSPATDEVVSVVVTGEDDDGDDLTYDYNWYVDGVSTGVTTDSLDGNVWFDGGQEVYCQVTAFDGTQYGSPFISDAVTIGNSPPMVTSITVSPDPAMTNDILTVAVTTSDDDGDSVSVVYRWSVDGVVIPSETSSTIDGSAWFDKGQSVVADATPNDGINSGTRVAATEVVISNSAPVVDSVTLSPADADAQSTITATVVADDADEDALIYSYVWSVDGVEVAGTSQTLSGVFVRDSVVSVAVVANDGSDDSAITLSSDLVVVNAAPSVVSVSFSDDNPATDAVLTATIETADADGDPVALAYDWLVDGVSVGVNSDTLDGASYFSRGQVVSLLVTPSDTFVAGEQYVAGPVVVANSAPTVTSVSLSPVDPTTNELVVATAAGADTDADTVSFTYRWLVDGVESAEIGDVLDGATLFSRDQIIQVEVTPWDDAVAGDPVTSSSVTVANTAPAITSVVLSPAEPGTEDTLTVIIAADDDDADDLSFFYSWSVNGIVVAETGETLSGVDYFSQGDFISVSVIPDDATDMGASVDSDDVTVGNSPVFIAAVTLLPSSAYTDDVVSAVVDASDADGDSISFEYSWTVDGVDVAGEVSSTLSGVSFFEKGQEVTVTVTPFDGIEYSDAVESSPLTIQNTTPSVTSVTFDPPTPVTSGLVRAEITTQDLDEDSVSASYRWFVNGSEVAEVGDTLDGTVYFDRDDSITVEVTPNDGEDDGYPLTSSVAVVGNTAPVISLVQMAPSAVGTNDVVTALPSSTDDDADAVSFSYVWTVDGVVVGDDSASLDGTLYFDVGQEVVVTVTPSDEFDSGSATASSAVIVGNSVPVVSAVTLSPDPAYTNDSVSAVVTATDSDGQPITLSYAWYVNGVLLFGETGSTLDGALHFDRDQTISVSVTPTDGTDSGGTFSSDAITVLNTEPVLDTISFGPASPDTDDVLTATVTTSDDDGDAVSVLYAWSVDGFLSVETGSTLDGGLFFSRDQVVGLVATPTDGTDNGLSVDAGDVLVLNTAPVVASILLSPAAPGTNDTVSAFVSASDLDDDSLTYTYEWSVDGVVVAATGYTLDGSTYFDVGQTISVSVAATDGTLTSSAVSSGTANVVNSLPSVSSVTLGPAPAHTDDAIVATVTASDPDGESVSVQYAWMVNGAPVTGSTDTLSDTALYAKDDLVSVMVTPSDASGSGASVTSSTLTISNSAPTMDTVALSPVGPTASSTISATVASTDIDTDSVTYTYTWTVNGVGVVGTSADLSSQFVRGDVVAITVTPNDGTVNGTPLTSDSVTVEDTAPEVLSLSITPVAPMTDDVLTANVTTSDLDGDAVTVLYAWSVNGVEVAGETGASLNGASFFDSGDTVSVSAVPADDLLSGTAFTSDAVTVGNSAPTVTSVSLTPSAVDTDGTLVADTITADADADAVTLTYSWTVDGAAVAETGSSLAGTTYFDRDQVVAVTVVPNDGTTAGASATSGSVTVSNTAPVLSSATISPANPKTDDVLSIVAVGTDLDNDAISYTYAWYVDGVAAGSDATLDGASAFSKGQTVAALVTPTDGTDAGTLAFSNSVSVENSAPSAVTVQINPATPVASQADLVCGITGGIDPDGDSLTHAFTWTVDGVSFGGAGTTVLTGDTIAAGDTCKTAEWTCSVSSSDGTETVSDTQTVQVTGMFCGTYDLASVGDITDGAIAGDLFGSAIQFVGDIDGDGGDDLLVGAPGAASGEVWALTDTTATSWTGEASGDGLGTALAGGVDLDGNGVTDLVLAAPFYDYVAGEEGVVYVVQSDAAGGDITSAATATIYGDAADGLFGSAVASLPDVNADGFSELFIGAPGADTVYGFSEALSGDYDVELDASLIITGAAGDFFGDSVIAVGDVTGDGIADFAVGAPGANGGVGAFYIFSATATGTLTKADALLTLEDDVASNGRLSAAGDLNNDGYADLVVGSPGFEGGGAAFVLSGPMTGFGTVVGSATAVVTGTLSATGQSVAGAGDVNADGFDDLLVASSGDVSLVFGPLVNPVNLVDAAATFINGDYSLVTGAGDADGDGWLELAISTPSANSDQGSIQVINAQ